MVSSLFTENNSFSSAVRQPIWALNFGSSSSEAAGGGLSGALGSNLDVGDISKQYVVSIAVETSLAPSVDVVEIYLSGGEQAPRVTIDDTGTIALGYEDSSTELILTGQIESTRHNLSRINRITATNGSATLAKLRVNQSYEQQTAGEIVNDLASLAEVETDTIEDGISFPFYVVDDRSTAYQHIANLAKKSGYLAYFTPEGKLNFAPFSAGDPVQTFTYGQDILALQLTDAAPVVGSVTTVGEGAAGSQGQDAWSWLVKDPASVQATAGEGDSEHLVSDASLRSSDAAQQVAAGLASAAAFMQLTGKLLVPGAPAVVVGSTIEITDAPQDALNGLCQVRWVRHHFSKHQGFTTQIGFSKAGEGGFGGLATVAGGLL